MEHIKNLFPLRQLLAKKTGRKSLSEATITKTNLLIDSVLKTFESSLENYELCQKAKSDLSLLDVTIYISLVLLEIHLIKRSINGYDSEVVSDKRVT